MALDDYVNPEIGIAVAATAVAFSPRARAFLRKGAVYALAGAIRVGDTVTDVARGAASEAQRTMSSGAQQARETTAEAKTTARSGRGSRAAGNGQAGQA
ncbi:MAG TPA: hypothetical protein VFB34_14330 [Chloroflexota bacterium]|nr:hypothetical protein [Chloroflexota bacterium]